MNISVAMKILSRPDSERFFAYLPIVLHKIICCGYLLESPPRGDSSSSPQHMILWRHFHFLSFNTDPRFPPFLLYVTICKSWIFFVRRCFRDDRMGTSTKLPNFMETSCFVLNFKRSDIVSFLPTIIEPRHEKICLCICESKEQNSCAVTTQLISVRLFVYSQHHHGNISVQKLPKICT